MLNVKKRLSNTAGELPSNSWRTDAATCRIEPLPADSYDHHFRRLRLGDSGALSSQAAIVSPALVGNWDRDLRSGNIDRVAGHVVRLAIGLVQGLVHRRGAVGRRAS